jgi:hypothetical protein
MITNLVTTCETLLVTRGAGGIEFGAAENDGDAVYGRDELVWDERVFAALVESFLEVFVWVDSPLQVAFVCRLALDEIGA